MSSLLLVEEVLDLVLRGLGAELAVVGLLRVLVVDRLLPVDDGIADLGAREDALTFGSAVFGATG